jgi:tRNA-modifying protein YgfZ
MNVTLYDRSDWGRIQFTGSDRIHFLHNQTTNDLKSLKPGEGCDTLFVTSTARTIDLATVYVLEDTILVVLSPNRREKILQWCDRYIFFGDQVTVKDISDETAMFSLIGSDSASLLAKFGIQVQDHSYASHQEITLAGFSVRLAIGDGVALNGYTLICDQDSKIEIYHALIRASAIEIGLDEWENLRITQGRPMPDAELTEDYNAVEASLWQAVSINKGCYIGQETIARLDTYKGVKQQIWGIELSGWAEPGTAIAVNEEKVGTLTSITQTPQGFFGLGYVRTKAGGSGLKVQVGESTGVLVEVPFLKRDRG